MDPLALFSLQFTFALVAYAIFAAWYVVPRLAAKPQAEALTPLLWVHVLRIAGGMILAPGSVDPGVSDTFRQAIGYGDMTIAALALIAVIALRVRFAGANWLVWLFLVAATLDTGNAIVLSMRYSVFSYPLGINWLIVTAYVPALLVSSILVLWRLLRPTPSPIAIRPA